MKKIKLIAEMNSYLNFTYCVQISQRLDEKKTNLATASLIRVSKTHVNIEILSLTFSMPQKYVNK